jgi:hypothetical protein
MREETQREFVPGDRVIFQYAQGTVLRGTIDGWSDKYNAYMLRCDTGRKLLVSSMHLRREPAEDPVIRQEREKDWPLYGVYMITHSGTQQVWTGKARTPRLAFLRAGKVLPILLDIVRCKDYKRLNARRKYPIGRQGEQAYCEKMEEVGREGAQVTGFGALVTAAEERPRRDRARRSDAKSVPERHCAA